jgi:hypothetical protein
MNLHGKWVAAQFRRRDALVTPIGTNGFLRHDLVAG